MANFSDVELGGVHPAKVINNQDEKRRERLFVRVLDIHDISDYNEVTDKFTRENYGIWVEHCAFSKRQSGDIPKPGDVVYILFFGNSGYYNPSQGIWIGIARENNFKR